MKKVKIMMKVGNYEAKLLETVKGEENAMAVIRRYEREDLYARDVEGYAFPNGMPVYFIAK